jgi:hypothetical protein
VWGDEAEEDTEDSEGFGEGWLLTSREASKSNICMGECGAGRKAWGIGGCCKASLGGSGYAGWKGAGGERL